MSNYSRFVEQIDEPALGEFWPSPVSERAAWRLHMRRGRVIYNICPLNYLVACVESLWASCYLCKQAQLSLPRNPAYNPHHKMIAGVRLEGETVQAAKCEKGAEGAVECAGWRHARYDGGVGCSGADVEVRRLRDRILTLRLRLTPSFFLVLCQLAALRGSASPAWRAGTSFTLPARGAHRLSGSRPRTWTRRTPIGVGGPSSRRMESRPLCCATKRS